MRTRPISTGEAISGAFLYGVFLLFAIVFGFVLVVVASEDPWILFGLIPFIVAFVALKWTPLGRKLL